MGISVGVYFFAGYLYDRFGARFNGVAGSVGVAAGLALLALGITRPSLNWLVYVGFTLADFAGSANSMALYGAAEENTEFCMGKEKGGGGG